MEGDFFVKCPKCGHKIPDMSDKCLYCGALTGGEASAQTKTESSEFMTSTGKMGKNFSGVQVTKEEIDYKKLDALPLTLRAKVEEMLKKGEGHSEEIKTSFQNFPESMEGTGRKGRRMGPLAALRILLKKD